MKDKLLFIVFTIFIISPIIGQTGNRHFETNGNFSIIPPGDWTKTEIPGLKYSIFYDSPINGFAPNIVIADENFTGILSQYVELNNQNMRIIYPDAEYIKEEAFITNNGIRGIKQIIINQNSGFLLRQFFYFFSNGNTKYVITGSVNNSSGQRFESIFDESIKTFDFIKK